MPRKKLSMQFTLKGNWRPGAYTPFSEILPHLFQGDCDGVQDSKFLRKHRISHVVTMGMFGPTEEIVAAQDLRVCEIDVKDSAGARIDEHFDEVVRFIHEGRSANGTLYVHCYSGVSGSSALVAAYLMTWLDVSYADAILFIRSCRPCADPNPSFKKQLKNFGNETEKMAKLREQLMKMGPAAKRDQRLADDTKLFNDAIDALNAQDGGNATASSSNAARVVVDNGVISSAAKKEEPAAEKDVAEEKDAMPPSGAETEEKGNAEGDAADNGAASAEQAQDGDAGQDAADNSEAQEKPSHERVEGNLEEAADS